jgi:hypothetical protein
MGEARKFIQRAPRYVLRPQDRKDMRFSLEHSVGEGGIEHTFLVNLSETGAAFVINHGMAPKVGDRIKVEVPIPQGDRIAWWGQVVRTSVYRPRGWFNNDRFHTNEHTLVALHFDSLPEPHTRSIRRGLNRSFMQAMRDQKYVTADYYTSFLREHFWMLMLYAALTIAVFGAMYYLSLPSANYDAKRGAPWGERFKFF